MTYILKTGNKGFERLNSVNLMYNKESLLFINQVSLPKNALVLDVGCGIGEMTIMLAKKIGSQGKVIAIDKSQEQIDIAKASAKKRGILNIEFIVDDAKNLINYQESIDVIYSRLMLVHQKNPNVFFKHYLKAVKTGGLIVCEEPITSSSICFPKSIAFDQHLSLYLKMGNEHGLNFDIGSSLHSIFQKNNTPILSYRKIQNTFSESKCKKIAYLRTLECEDVYLKNKYISKSNLSKTLRELLILSENKSQIVSGVEMVQILGRKEFKCYLA